MKSVYIHIPFCNSICSYCDFSKMFYNKEFVKKYLEALEKEILENYKNEVIKTIYIGGGTPSALNIDELEKLFKLIEIFNKNSDCEFTIECNIENLNKEKLILFKKNNVNRLSIGIQTFNEKFLKILNRNHSKKMVYEIIDVARIIGFNNINLDLMYALPNQTFEELKNDINEFLKLNPEHISSYSLMLSKNTKLYIDNFNSIDEDVDLQMYDYIKYTLKENGYNNYEISNYSRLNKESLHNLVYWNNECYYGFGLGASGYLDNYRYENTKNFNKYINGFYVFNIEKLDKILKMKYELILGFRKRKGINKKDFYDKYNEELISIKNIGKFIQEKKLIDDGFNIYIEDDWIYRSNEILMYLL